MSLDVTPAKTFSARVAEEIRVVMTRRQIRQSELARAIGTNDQWLSVRLRGVQPIDLNDLEIIAAALHVQPEILVRSASQPPHVTAWSPSATAPSPRVDATTRPPGRPVGQRRPMIIHGH